MAKDITSSDIRQYSSDRAELEVALARKLYGVYARQPIIGEIQNIIGLAVENVIPMLTKTKYPKSCTECAKEDKLVVWKKYAGGPPKTQEEAQSKLRMVWDEKHRWTPADCSDLARLFGTVMETMVTENTYEGASWNVMQGTQHRLKPEEFYKNYDPNKPGAQKPAQVSRTRTGATFVGKSMTDTHTFEARNKGLKARLADLGSSGIEPFRLLQGSTVRKIDLAFGLPEGADISGTTSDSLITMRRVLKFTKAYKAFGISTHTLPSSILKLLPLVTMVSAGHHTLLESALTLTINGVVNYAIGFYPTLFPRDAAGVEAGGDINKILNEFEHDIRNRHILCWYDSVTRQYTGSYYTARHDVDDFRKIATTSASFLRFFRDRVHSAVYEKDLEPLVHPRVKIGW